MRMDNRNASGFYIYKKGLRQKKRPYAWFVIVAVLFFLLFYAYQRFTGSDEIVTSKNESPVPVRIERLVNDNRMFVSGWCTNEVFDLNYRTAKQFGVKRFLPFIGSTAYKEFFTLCLLQSNAIIAIDGVNLSSVRTFTYTFFNFMNNNSYYETTHERYSRRLFYAPFFNAATARFRGGDTSVVRTLSNITCTLRIDRKAHGDVTGLYDMETFGWMLNWRPNKALFTQVKTGLAVGKLEVPGDTFVLENVPFIAEFRAGIAPTRLSTERMLAVCRHPWYGPIPVVVFASAPAGSAVGRAFYRFRGQWTPVPDIAVVHNDQTRVTTAESTNGTVIAFTPRYTLAKRAGMMYPVTDSTKQHGTVRITFRYYGDIISADGIGMREKARSLW